MSTRMPRKIKVGKFSVSRRVIDDQPVLARRLMRDIIIVRAETSYVQDAVEYIGLCDEFEPISELDPNIPTYNIEKDGYGRRKITKVVNGAPALIANDPDDVDEDEDCDRPRIAKRGRPAPAKKAPVGCDCDENDCGCHLGVGAKTGRVSSRVAAFEETAKAHPVVQAVGKMAAKKTDPTDHMLITREFIEGSR